MRKTPHPNTEYIVKNGRKTAVVLPIAEYEDLHDLAVLARRKAESTIPLLLVA